MTKPRNSLAFMLLSLGPVLALIAGCGGSSRTVKVHGVVTLDSQPLGGATITFIPQSQGSRPASGVSDSEGSFQLTTFNSGDGALPGDYLVVVTRNPPPPEPGPGAPQDEPDTEKGMAKMGRHGEKKTELMSAQGKQKIRDAQRKQPRSQVPALYSDQTTTPLKQVVPPAGTVKLELSSKPQEPK